MPIHTHVHSDFPWRPVFFLGGAGLILFSGAIGGGSWWQVAIFGIVAIICALGF